MSLGPLEILLVLVVALMVFGPTRLPEVSRQVGAAMRELRRMQDTVKAEIDTVIRPELDPSQTTSTTKKSDERNAQGARIREEPDHTALPRPSAEQLIPDSSDDGFPESPGSFT